jgi:hypothetical protein
LAASQEGLSSVSGDDDGMDKTMKQTL